MARTQRLRPPDDFVGLTCPPRTGAERLRWFDTLDRLLELDILAQRLQLRAAGWTPAGVEGAMADYRSWITGRIGATCDRFDAELAWLAS